MAREKFKNHEMVYDEVSEIGSAQSLSSLKATTEHDVPELSEENLIIHLNIIKGSLRNDTLVDEETNLIVAGLVSIHIRQEYTLALRSKLHEQTYWHWQTLSSAMSSVHPFQSLESIKGLCNKLLRIETIGMRLKGMS